MRTKTKSPAMWFMTLFGKALSAIFLSSIILSFAAKAHAQIVPCSPGPGGPPPGSIPRAIAKAPPLAILPNVPIPGAWLWVLSDTRHLTLLHIPLDWPAVPPNQVITMNLDTLPGFGIPESYDLYDVATGPGNIGLGVFFSSAWVIGRDPITGERRAQRVGLSPGSPPGGCFISGAAELINPRPASIAAVEYPQDSITNHFWVLRPEEMIVEPGAGAPTQTLSIQHIPSGVVPNGYSFIEETQIFCAPGLGNCPSWGDTRIEQIHQFTGGGGLRLLLRNQTTGAQRLGTLAPGGFFAFNSCAGATNPCLEEILNLPAPLNGNVIDIAEWSASPGPIWVLWSEDVTTPSGEAAAIGGVDATAWASVDVLVLQSDAVTYHLGALASDGALLGSIPLGIAGGSGGGQVPDLEVIPKIVEFGDVAKGEQSDQTITLRNGGQGDLAITSIALTDRAAFAFSICDRIQIPFLLRPHEMRQLRICFAPKAVGVFESTLVIGSNDPDEATLAIPLTGRVTSGSESLKMSLSVDRGCTARYRIGEPVTISYQALKDAIVTLKLLMPDGAERVLFTGRVRGGVSNSLRGVVGEPTGERRLILETTTGQLHARAECTFTAIRGALPTLEARITTNKGRLESLVETGEDPVPKPVFLPDERIHVLLRFDTPGPLKGLARVEWEQGGQRSTVFLGMITSNTDVSMVLLPPFSERQVESMPVAHLSLNVTSTDAAHPFDLHDTCAIEIFYGHTLEITKIVGAGGAKGTKWNDADRKGKVGSVYTFTATVKHEATDAHSPAAGHAVNYSFDWGDGSPVTATNPASHAWASPGTYLVRIKVTDAAHAGLEDDRTIKVVIGALTAADHRLEIKTVAVAGGAGPTKWKNTSGATKLSGVGAVNVAYTFTADIDHDANDEHAPTAGHAVNYTFDWGDGSNTLGNAAAHSWTGPGVYIVRVTADDAAHAGLSHTRIMRVFIEDDSPDSDPWVDGYVVPGGEILLVGSSFQVGGNKRTDTVRVEAGLEWHKVKNQELQMTVTITYCNGAIASRTITRRLMREGLYNITVAVESAVPIDVKVRQIDVSVTGRAQRVDEVNTPVNDVNPLNGNNRVILNCP